MRLIVCALLLATAVSTQPPSTVGSNSGVVIFDDIANTTKVAAVYQGGIALDRTAMRAAFR